MVREVGLPTILKRKGLVSAMIIYSPNCNPTLPYCVYLTIYSGNKLPPFYVGSGTISKIKNGYRGSVCSQEYKSIWQSELKVNPHLFKIYILKTYNKRDQATQREVEIQRQFQVHKNLLYINKAYWHNKIHYVFTEEQRKKNK